MIESGCLRYVKLEGGGWLMTFLGVVELVVLFFQLSDQPFSFVSGQRSGRHADPIVRLSSCIMSSLIRLWVERLGA